MGDEGSPAELDATVLDRQDRVHALIPLRLALGWTMAPDLWPAVGDLVERMHSTLARGDVAGFRAASAALARAGPDRATKLGDTPTVPAPDRIRERINEQIDTLNPSSPDPPPEPASPSGR
jgi:hypothetical protein